MKDNRCPVCGRELNFGEPCYHDESLRQSLIHTFYGLKALEIEKITPLISLRKIRIAHILKERYDYDIYTR